MSNELEQGKKKSRARWGDGSAYLIGRKWYISLSVDGKQMTRSTGLGLKDKKAALEMLKDWRESARKGLPEPVVVSATTVNACLDLIERDYEQKKLHTLIDLRCRLKLHLRPALGDKQACSFTDDDKQAYVAQRLSAGAAIATVANEISALKRGFALAVKKGLLARRPEIEQVDIGDNSRKGFLDPDQFRVFVELLPSHVAVFAIVAYQTGCRKGELLGLTWDKVDLEGGMVRLNSGDTKNGKPRCIPLTAECVQILSERKRIKDGMSRNFPFVFFYECGGRPCVLAEFRAAWELAAEAIGRPGLRPHDFRRSFIRNAVRAAVPQKIIMEASGHLTDSIFRRYDIVDERDLRGLADKVEKYSADFGRRPEAETPAADQVVN